MTTATMRPRRRPADNLKHVGHLDAALLLARARGLALLYIPHHARPSTVRAFGFVTVRGVK